MKDTRNEEESTATEWLCKFCGVWNTLTHRYCKRCLAKLSYALKEQR